MGGRRAWESLSFSTTPLVHRCICWAATYQWTAAPPWMSLVSLNVTDGINGPPLRLKYDNEIIGLVSRGVVEGDDRREKEKWHSWRGVIKDVKRLRGGEQRKQKKWSLCPSLLTQIVFSLFISSALGFGVHVSVLLCCFILSNTGLFPCTLTCHISTHSFCWRVDSSRLELNLGRRRKSLYQCTWCEFYKKVKLSDCQTMWPLHFN